MFQALFDNFHRFGHFSQKLFKIGLWRMPFGLCNGPEIFFVKNFEKNFDFWSLDQLVVETLGVASVSPCVHSFVLAILVKTGQNWPFGWMCGRVPLRTGNP